MLDDFYHAMSTDLLVGFFFDGKDLKKIAQMQKKFLLRAMGVNPSYEGKAPAQAHSEIAPILKGHFDRRLRILEEVLKKYGLTPKSIKTWIEFEETFRPGIQAD